ncbi:MAG TPA: nucleotide sugar dehydrogenase [Candidatus Bathyarchaeota archaeon]|nr:nucleotide sugar dehydrogenase [Candidatus Bathyarchaeota archaeon]
MSQPHFAGAEFSVIGLGRDGLCLACIIAEAGLKVYASDPDRELVYLSARASPPYHEPKLNELIKKCMNNGRLAISGNPREAVSKSSAIFITTPPTTDEAGKLDFTPLQDSCREVGMALNRGAVVIVKSLVSVGLTGSLLREVLEEASGFKAGKDFHLAYSPPRTRPGRVLKDLRDKPWILGAVNERSLAEASRVVGLVAPKVFGLPSLRAAEAVQLLEYLRMEVDLALANQLARLCERLDVDYGEVRNVLEKELGNTGLPKPESQTLHQLLTETIGESPSGLRLLKSARLVNEEMVKLAVKLTKEALRGCGKRLRRSKIAILGVSETPDSESARKSPVLKLLPALSRARAQIAVYDPKHNYRALQSIGYPAERSLSDAVKNSDCIIIAVPHKEFRQLTPKKLKTLTNMPAAVVDMPRILDGTAIEAKGLVYAGPGWRKKP